MDEVIRLIPSSFSDPDFIECLKKMDEEAWRRFYLEIAPKLKGFISISLADYRNHWDVNATADDIVNEAFEKAFKSIHTYRIKDSALETWMFNIAKNTFKDLTRKFKSEKSKMERWLEYFGAGSDQTVITVEELCNNMKISSNSLTKLQKAYLDMLFIQQWSTKLIAEKMEVSENAVIKAKGRLLSRLRELLEQSRAEVSGINKSKGVGGL